MPAILLQHNRALPDVRMLAHDSFNFGSLYPVSTQLDLFIEPA
jgi:hypothetical protein